MSHKVTHIVYSLYHGGAEHIISTLLRCGDSASFTHSVLVLSSGGSLIEEIEKSGGHVLLLGKKKGFDPALPFRLASLIRKTAPDIIHLHNSSPGVWGTLASMISRTGIPLVKMEHRPWIPKDLPLFHRTLYRYLAKKSEKIITVSEDARSTFSSSFPSLESRLVTVLNGIDLTPYKELQPVEECRKWFGLPLNCPLIGSIGRLVPVKNHRILIEAFLAVKKRYPDAHLAILGQGPLEPSLRSYAASRGISESLSILPATLDVYKFLGALDVFVLPSRSEGLPLTLLEAMASALPVIASSVGGIPEVIEDEEDGFLTASGSSSEITEKIFRILEDPESAASMGVRGRDKIFRNFSEKRFIEQIESIYLEILKKRK
ncbi:MAG: glycosyltransferase [Candidatus Krumholzibacteriota bacterium]|nr:glycosyltransferase [Candidatus Krumholzibacteriota bacterium]